MTVLSHQNRSAETCWKLCLLPNSKSWSQICSLTEEPNNAGAIQEFNFVIVHPVTLNGAPYMSRISKKFVYAFNKVDWSHLRSLFQYSPWDLALAGEDINDNWTAWKDIFFAAVDDCIPKYRQKKRLTAPWITKDLIKLCRKKKCLYKKAKKSGKEETWIAYRALNSSTP